jgi:hypothetical protein
MGSAMETTQQHMTVQRFMRLKTNTLIQREYYHQTILFVMHMLNRAERSFRGISRADDDDMSAKRVFTRDEE